MSDPTPEQIQALPCPACLAPAGVSCGEQPHTDRIIAAQARNLTHGRCALCGQPMVHGSLDGAPIDAWHPDPDDAAACPRIPDPAQDWEAYATAVNLGLTPGHPGAEHFVPDGEQHEVIAGEVTTLTGTDLPESSHAPRGYTVLATGIGASLGSTAQGLVDAGHAPDQATAGAGLHRALHESVTEPLATTGPRPVLCPECAAGKCPNCDGTALDPVTDTIVPCTCDHGGPL